MTALLAMLGYSLFGIGAPIIISTAFVCMTGFAFAYGSQIVLKMLNVQAPDHFADLPMMSVFMSDLEVLAVRADMPAPGVLLIDTGYPNAFAVGSNGANSTIVVTTGLMKTLTRTEVAGVVAHELAHIRKGDAFASAFASAFVAMIVYPFHKLKALFRREPEPALALSHFAPVSGGLAAVLVGKHREYKADRVGAEICGDASYLMSALQKIERAGRASVCEGLEKHPEFSHLLTLNPKADVENSLFATHPPTSRRIAELRMLVTG
jgi:heat shock protein HtpX